MINLSYNPIIHLLSFITVASSLTPHQNECAETHLSTYICILQHSILNNRNRQTDRQTHWYKIYIYVFTKRHIWSRIEKKDIGKSMKNNNDEKFNKN